MTSRCESSLFTLAPAALALVGMTLVACGGDVAPQVCAATGETKGAVVTHATFARQLDDVTAEGLDIDGAQSIEGDPAGCYKQDFTSPDGQFGIDNQFATLLPLIEEFVGTENIDALLDGAIANGQLLIILAVDGVDDPYNDDCVDVRMGAGIGSPYLNTENDYEPYQTFAFDPDSPVGTMIGRIENGVLTAGPGPIVLPVRILDADFNLELDATHVRFDVAYDPLQGGIALEGIASGGISVEAFKTIVTDLNIGTDVIGALLPILAGKADLAEDSEGTCRRISAALKLTTTTAYVLD